MDDSPDRPEPRVPAYGPEAGAGTVPVPAPNAASTSAPKRRIPAAGWALAGFVVLLGVVVATQIPTQGSLPDESLPAETFPVLPTEVPPETEELLGDIARLEGVASAELPEPARYAPEVQATRIVVVLETPLPPPEKAQLIADEVIDVVRNGDGRLPDTVRFEASQPGSGARFNVVYQGNGAGYAGPGKDPVSDAVVLISGAHPVGRVTFVGASPTGGRVEVSEPGTLRPAADEARRLSLPIGTFRVEPGPGDWLSPSGTDAPDDVPPDAGLAMIEQVVSFKNVTTAIYDPNSTKNSGRPYLEVVIQDDPAPVAELLDKAGYADQLGFPITYKVWGIDESGETSRIGWVSGRTADGAASAGGARSDDGVAGLPACTSKMVRAELPWTDAATGDRFLGLRATNRSDSACALGRRPDVSFLSEDGSAPDILIEPVGQGAEPVVLEPGRSANSMIEWGAGATAGGVPLTTAVLLNLPGDDEPVRLPVTDVEGIHRGLDLLHGATAELEPWQLGTE